MENSPIPHTRKIFEKLAPPPLTIFTTYNLFKTIVWDYKKALPFSKNHYILPSSSSTMKLLYLLPLLVSIVGVGAGRISEQENEETQMICGKRADGHHRKVINGEYVKKGEHPWAVTVYMRFLDKKNQFDLFYGVGTMISSRHIVKFNSLFNTGKNTDNLNLNGHEYTGYKGICEGDNLIVPQELLSRFDADFEYLNDVNKNREFHNTVAKVTVIHGCKELLTSNPMIIELIAPLDNNTVPACISNSARNWERVDEFSVYGTNKAGPLVSGRFKPIECSASAPFSCAEASNKSQGLCNGDFGGSAIANMDHRHVMLGFYAGDNTDCRGNTETMDPFKFVNLGHYRQEICEATGVCVPPPVEDVTPEPQPEAPSTTAAPEEGTTTHYSVNGEEIKAETFAPLIVSNSSTKGCVTNGSSGEVIKAETFEPMLIDHRGSTRADRVRDIHIHIHLNK
ncbi:hypothetical protein B9Z55_016905 [Caenorhabditis nigoni]|uniref:Peptidase S1 domain-containing protein n=2 Tax=Caenorhabditis nigoni TaxID=1611254 RepID=A0A2G5T751_9PELO|nr:hypothetical protein B9Z55_016905 [Caenorhabditis nigoni]